MTASPFHRPLSDADIAGLVRIAQAGHAATTITAWASPSTSCAATATRWTASAGSFGRCDAGRRPE
jgi:hypothetical protein